MRILSLKTFQIQCILSCFGQYNVFVYYQVTIDIEGNYYIKNHVK